MSNSSNGSTRKQLKDGRQLTKAQFIAAVRQALQDAGMDYKLCSGHSFRIGAATTAHNCGFNEATIKMLGRWESSAYLLYIRTPGDQVAGLTSRLAE